MGRTNDDPAGLFVNWGNPAFFSGATAILVAWWLKVSAFGTPLWGPACVKTDFSTRGWWAFENTPDKIDFSTWGTGGASGTILVPAPVAGQGWIHTGFWLGNVNALVCYKNGTPATLVATADSGIDTADALAVALPGSGAAIAEIGIWAESDGSLTNAVADTIMAKLANPAHAERRAIDITDKAAKFYAPLDVTDADLVGGAPFSGSVHWIDAGDHPWALATIFRSINYHGA
jgi:hypothetical protein